MNIRSGEVIEADGTTNLYRVMIQDIGDRWATDIEAGVTTTYELGSKVCCLYSEDDGWLIVGMISSPVRDSLEGEDLDATTEDYLSSEEARLSSKTSQDERNSLLRFRPPDRDPDLQGEVSLRNSFAGTDVRLFNDGSILARCSDILLFYLNNVWNTLVLRCSKMIFGADGLAINHGIQDTSKTVSDAGPQPTKIRTDVTYAYDPDKPEDFDFKMQLGEIDQAEQQLPADSTASVLGSSAVQTLKRGLRIFLRTFGILEIDNDQNSIDLEIQTPAEEGEATPLPKTVHIDKDSVVIDWSGQVLSIGSDGLSFEDTLGRFLMFKDGKFLVKADKIGFVGPISMWDTTEGQAIKLDTGYPAKDQPAFARDSTGATGSGIYFDQSVYFGDAKQPAILKGLYDQHYSLVWDALKAHVHSSPAGGSTGTMEAPLVEALNATTLNNPAVTDLWFSLIKIPI